MLQAADQMHARDYPAAVQTLLSSGAFEYSREHNPRSFAQIRQLVTDNLQSFAMFPRYRWHEADAMKRLGDIAARTLVLVSEHAGDDALKIAAELTRQIRDIERATVPVAGHVMNMDNPAGFNREVLRFLGTRGDLFVRRLRS